MRSCVMISSKINSVCDYVQQTSVKKLECKRDLKVAAAIWLEGEYRWRGGRPSGRRWPRRWPPDKWSCRRAPARCFRCWGRWWSRRTGAPRRRRRQATKRRRPWAKWRSAAGRRSPPRTGCWCVRPRSGRGRTWTAWFWEELKMRRRTPASLVCLSGLFTQWGHCNLFFAWNGLKKNQDSLLRGHVLQYIWLKHLNH